MNCIGRKFLNWILLSVLVIVFCGTCLYALSFPNRGDNNITLPFLVVANRSIDVVSSGERQFYLDVNELIRKYEINTADGDSLLIFFDLGKVLSEALEYENADHLFTLALQKAESVGDVIQIEIERGINASKWTGNPLHTYLLPLLQKTDKERSPYREIIKAQIYELLADNFVPSEMDGYPDSPVFFIDKALEYKDFIPIGKAMSMLYSRYQILLDFNHREAIRSVDSMLSLINNRSDSETSIRNWHVMAYITRGDYCMNEELDCVGAAKYYKAALSCFHLQSVMD